MKKQFKGKPFLFIGVFAAVSAYASTFCAPANADAVSQAVRMHQRLVGVPPSATVRNQMATLINDGRPLEAAAIAIEDPLFYSMTLKNWSKPLTNEDEAIFVPMNDMVATIVGLIRDDRPFTEVLHADVLYTAADGTPDVPVYAADNNNHYAALENASLKALLVPKVQSSLNGINDAAGILTSRAFGEAFMTAGTNRAVVRWAFKNFLCMDMEQVADVSINDYRVRRDVDRAPGGDSRTFKSQCVGCHAGMDSLSNAAAYFDFQNGRVTEGTNVVGKINAQVKFSGVPAVSSNAWINLWATGQNTRLGFSGATTGNGLESFGQLVAGTQEFNRCMAKRVFKQVCQRDAVLDASKANSEVQLIQQFANVFKDNNHSMKDLFAAVANHCKGQ
jgi:hypothetical protein